MLITELKLVDMVKRTTVGCSMRGKCHVAVFAGHGGGRVVADANGVQHLLN